MEDSLSVKSNESTGTSDDFDFVSDKPGSSRTPVLDCGGGLNELTTTLAEVLKEAEQSEKPLEKMIDSPPLCENPAEGDKKTAGQSTFYGSPVDPGKDPLSQELSPSEKQDSVKPEGASEEESSNISDIDQECTIFSGVTYLGAAQINAPRSEAEIHRNMAILNEQTSEQGIKVSVSIPLFPTGVVVLYDATTNQVISRYEIHRILFFARGPTDTKEESCFAFTWSHGDPQENAILQCHVFRCDIVEAVWRVSGCFTKAFHPKVPRSMSSSVTSTGDIMSTSLAAISEPKTLMYVFEVNLEMREEDGKGSFTTVGKDRNGFRLRTNLEKQLVITIKQVSDNGPQLVIERCFGVLVAPGREVKHHDMQLLERQERKKGCSENNFTKIKASWDPTEKNFEPLNSETPKDVKQYMTVAVDLVIRGIQEPVRFLLETPVRIFSQNERNPWYFQKRSMVQQFFLNLKEVVTSDLTDVYYEVLSMEHSGELDRNLLNLSLNFSSFIQSPSSIASLDAVTPKEEEQSDNDEPLLSGTGLVSKDCSEDVLVNWGNILTKWKLTNQRPKELTKLVKEGIPEALRCAVWQRLAGVENSELMQKYNTLITQECSCENVIQRDIARTFPAHDFFKEAGGLGQDSLYKVSKAYALYDLEVGYCQGLSFLAATLLLHMPEEEAFCVLVKLMYDYKLRDLYKDGFDNLYLRLYQLNRLMEEQLAPLYAHFEEHRIETHMFASQWFLTLFTARFPLYFVFNIIDVFLLQGIDTLFQMALALLTWCKKDLLQLDFEGILKYFRVSLPKRCRSEEAAHQLIKLACSIKVKKLKKYEADFIQLKEVAARQEEKASEVEILKLTLARLEDEKTLMIDEIVQLKEMLKREVETSDNEKEKNRQIMEEYQVVRQRLDVQLKSTQHELENLKANISSCPTCSENLKKETLDPPINGDGDPLEGEERIRELELQLAQAKLDRVEAECKNQNLTHRLRATEQELASTKNTWMSKALTSIKEVANKKDFTNIGGTMQGATFISHINSAMNRGDNSENKFFKDDHKHHPTRRDSVPARRDSVPTRRDSVPLRSDRANSRDDNIRRESAPVIKDSHSYDSLRSTD